MLNYLTYVLCLLLSIFFNTNHLPFAVYISKKLKRYSWTNHWLATIISVIRLVHSCYRAYVTNQHYSQNVLSLCGFNASDIDKCSLSVARSKNKNNQDTIFFRFKYKAKLTLKYKWDEYTRGRNPLVIYLHYNMYCKVFFMSKPQLWVWNIDEYAMYTM